MESVSGESLTSEEHRLYEAECLALARVIAVLERMETVRPWIAGWDILC